MRLASFRHDDRQSFGVVLDRHIADLGPTGAGRWPSLRGMLNEIGPALAGLNCDDAPLVDLAEISWLPVVPDPSKIVCVGLNYLDHVHETARKRPEYPVLFPRFANSQIGHLEGLVRPRVSEQLDFEGELAVVVGRQGRHVSPGDALQLLAGYSAYNEASVRDWQKHSHQYTAGKNFPGTGAFGPWMVTADEISDPTTLQLTTRVNGQVMQQGNVADMIFSIQELISYISQLTELVPGDVIVTGTPGGVGGLRVPPIWLKPGDLVEVEISKIGVLRNPVVLEGSTW